MEWLAYIRELFGQGYVQKDIDAPARGPRKLVVILDGTLSSLEPGCETNAGLTSKLLRDGAHPDVSLYYEAGIQWADWGDTIKVMRGDGINTQIRRAYGWLASRYRPGDQIYLIGYSRGAYAVRSLAGVVGKMGLLKPQFATERKLRALYRLYQSPDRDPARFARLYCEQGVEIEAIAVWDTVKALGLRLPLIWMVENELHDFHDHRLGPHVRRGFQALALNETRRAFEPILWESRPTWQGALEQVWFRGTHGDVGGQLGGRHASRPLSNVPLVWMLGRLEASGLPLPDGWQTRFPADANAPSIGALAGWAKFFWNRRRRKVGRDPSERIHDSVPRGRGAAPRFARE
ncbi:MAG: DUF2235 domain-containing protein [Pseudomonadota bacterium]